MDRVTEAYQDLLKEIVEKKKLANVERRRPPKRPKGPMVKAVLAVLLPPIAAAVWIFQPFAPGPPPPTRVPDEEAAWQAALIDAATTIKDFRDSVGAFPLDLAAADLHLKGVTYVVDGPESFTLQTYTSEGLVSVWMRGDTVGTGARPLPAPPATP